MSYDITKVQETEIRKNFDKLESQISKSQICEDNYLPELLTQMDHLLKDTQKKIKNYQIQILLILLIMIYLMKQLI